MILNPQVPLNRLVLSLSEALDHVNPSVADHQLRVAYMSTRIARLLGFGGSRLQDVFHAAALHDIGMLRADNRIRAVALNRLEGLNWHSEAGYALLKDNEFFAQAAPLVRHHHAMWRELRGESSAPRACFVLSLADTVDRHIRRTAPILHQVKEIKARIVRGRGEEFSPECVDAFLEASHRPAFWLDVTSKQIYSILHRGAVWPTLMVDESAVASIAQVFGRVVDSLSAWTGVHSAGVAATAAALAERFNLSPREQILMRAAGYLHDLGKITVPTAILDKQGKPTEEEWAILQGHTYHTFHILDTIGGLPQVCEWAAFHHERLDGQGYPFGHHGADLTLGARIMAVADTFTAVSEDRPYRRGMERAEALGVLRKLVDGRAMDGQIVEALARDFDAIARIRGQEQAAYAPKQDLLTQLSGAQACAAETDRADG